MTGNTNDTIDISLEERLATSLAGRLLGYSEKDADDIANVKDSLEDALRDAGVRLCRPIKAGVYVTPDLAEVSDFLEEMFKGAPLGRVTDEEDGEDGDAAAELAELRHMLHVADEAYRAFSDLALHSHGRRENVMYGIASRAAGEAHDIAGILSDRIRGMEDED